MNTAKNQLWIESLGINGRSCPDLFLSVNEVIGVPHAAAMRRGFNKLRLAGFFCIDSIPTIAFLEQKKLNRFEINSVHKALWNQGLVSLLLVILPEEIGTPSTWLIKFQDVHDKVLHVIKDVWPDCAKRFHPDALENRITDQLALMLQRDPRSRGNWRVDPQHKLLDSDQAGDVVTKGFIDFIVIFDLNQDNYIAYECKRLNVLFPSTMTY